MPPREGRAKGQTWVLGDSRGKEGRVEEVGDWEDRDTGVGEVVREADLVHGIAF